MRVRVFIENEAGSNRKHRHNEKTLEFLHTEEVSRPYPFPYGFILDTTAGDGMNLDCFVITSQKLRTGQIVVCEPIGLMEQIDAGDEDHNVLARLPDESVEITPDLEAALVDFSCNVFQHVEGKHLEPGRFLDADDAIAHIQACRDD